MHNLFQTTNISVNAFLWKQRKKGTTKLTTIVSKIVFATYKKKIHKGKSSESLLFLCCNCAFMESFKS